MGVVNLQTHEKLLRLGLGFDWLEGDVPVRGEASLWGSFHCVCPQRPTKVGGCLCDGLEKQGCSCVLAEVA